MSNTSQILEQLRGDPQVDAHYLMSTSRPWYGLKLFIGEEDQKAAKADLDYILARCKQPKTDLEGNLITFIGQYDFSLRTKLLETAKKYVPSACFREFTYNQFLDGSWLSFDHK